MIFFCRSVGHAVSRSSWVLNINGCFLDWKKILYKYLQNHTRIASFCLSDLCLIPYIYDYAHARKEEWNFLNVFAINYFSGYTGFLSVTWSVLSWSGGRLVEFGVRSTSVLSHTWSKHIHDSSFLFAKILRHNKINNCQDEHVVWTLLWMGLNQLVLVFCFAHMFCSVQNYNEGNSTEMHRTNHFKLALTLHDMHICCTKNRIHLHSSGFSSFFVYYIYYLSCTGLYIILLVIFSCKVTHCGSFTLNKFHMVIIILSCSFIFLNFKYDSRFSIVDVWNCICSNI